MNGVARLPAIRGTILLLAILGTSTPSTAQTPPPQPTVQFSASSYSIPENGTAVTITATLSASSSDSVTVKYKTHHGTAKATTDFTRTSGKLTFAPGDTSATLQVAITDDSMPEPSEAFSIELLEPVNATLGDPKVATVTILDNDAWPMLTLIPYRTGTNSGQEVAQTVKDEGNPQKYVVLTGGPAKLTLKQITPAIPEGTLKIEISGSVQVRKANGNVLQPDKWQVNLAHPSGYLAGLTAGDVDIQVEGLSPDPDCVVAYVYEDTTGVERARDEVHILFAEYTLSTSTGQQVVPLVPAETLRFRGGILSLPMMSSDGKDNFDQIGVINPQAMFKIALNGLPTSAVTSVIVQSDSGSENYADEGMPGAASYLSKFAACVYQGTGTQALYRPGETDTIKTNLGLNVVPGTAATATIVTLMDRFVQQIDTLYIKSQPSQEPVGGRVLVDYAPGAAISFKAKSTLAGGVSSWTIISKPDEATVAPATGTGSIFSFTTDLEGPYLVQLTYSINGYSVSTTLFALVYYPDNKPNPCPGPP